MIEDLRLAAGRHHHHPARGSDDAGGGLGEPDAVAPGGRNFRDVGLGSALDCPPRMLGAQSQETVVMEEPQQEAKKNSVEKTKPHQNRQKVQNLQEQQRRQQPLKKYKLPKKLRKRKKERWKTEKWMRCTIT